VRLDTLSLRPLDGAYCNALLLRHWSVRQKLNQIVQFSSVQLRRSVRDLKLSGRNTDAECKMILYRRKCMMYAPTICSEYYGRVAAARFRCTFYAVG